LTGVLRQSPVLRPRTERTRLPIRLMPSLVRRATIRLKTRMLPSPAVMTRLLS
jgi:hypothetical protein